jgi:DNA-binding Lrp family transcriptional regulator
LRRGIEDWYDGYSWDGKTRVYNPWAVLSFFDEASFFSHWYESGTPRFLIDLIRSKKFSLNYTDQDIIINRAEAIIDDIKLIKPSVLMLQTGYMTIKERIPPTDGRKESFRLDLPNREVAESLVPELLSAGPPNKTPARETSAKSVLDRLRGLDEEGIQRAFGDYLKKFKFSSILEHESYYQSLLEVALEWAGQEVESQRAASQGVLDILFSDEKDRYTVELKVFREKKPKPGVPPPPPTDPADAADLRGKMAPKADEALKQIRERYSPEFKPDPEVHGIVRVHGIAIVVARRTFVMVKIEKDVPPPAERPMADRG